MSISRFMTVAIALTVATSRATAQYQTVSLAGLTNSVFFAGGVTNGGYYPFGTQVLGGVPFAIDQSIGEVPQARGWFSSVAGGVNPVSVVVPVNVFGVDRVYTLINSLWGQAGPGAYASLTFTGSSGAVFVKELVGGVDIRNYETGAFTNSINGTSTVNVFNVQDILPLPGNQRLDRQQIDLPAAFLSQTLTSVTLTDIGGTSFSRTFLAGITTQGATVVPEPATLSLVAAGGLCLVAFARRKRVRKPEA